MIKYEYMVLIRDIEQAEDNLNTLGEGGWKLVGVNQYRIYMMREKTE